MTRPGDNLLRCVFFTGAFLIMSLLCTVLPATAQLETGFGNCPEITPQDLGDFDDYSSDGLISSVVGLSTSIQRLEVVCQSSGTAKDTFRSACVYVEYFLNSSTTPRFEEGFCFVCGANHQWIPNPIFAGPSSLSGDSMDYTTLSSNCSFCHLAAISSMPGISEYYCIVCDSSNCIGTGLCYGDENGTQSECCNFYFGSNCVERCPDLTLPNSTYDCVSTSDPTFQVGQSLFILPEALIGRVGQPLLIYCGPDNFTVFKDGVQLSPHISLVNITSITLDDAGIYTCQEVGVARSTTIFAIMPNGSSSEVFITDSNFMGLLNNSNVNSFVNLTETIHCFSPSGHGQLEWRLEEVTSNGTSNEQLRNELRNATGEAMPYMFSISDVNYTIGYEVTSPPVVHHLYLKIEVPSRNNVDHFLICRSRVSQGSQYVTVTDSTTLIPSPNVTVREGETVILSCIPSVLDLLVVWSIVGPMGLQSIKYASEYFDFPNENHHSLVIKSVSSRDGMFECSVGNSIAHVIVLTVLSKCLPSLAAGLLWNTSYTGDILSYRCNDIDSQFSNLVKVSRLCGEFGNWSDLDFSNCTLRSYQEPFFLLWLYINTTANLNQTLTTNQITSVIEEYTPFLVVPSSVSISIVSLSGAITGAPSTPDPSPGQILYRASVVITSYVGFNIQRIRAAFVRAPGDIGGSARILPDDVFNADIYYFFASTECECNPYLFPGSGSPRTHSTCVGGVTSPCVCSVYSTQAVDYRSIPFSNYYPCRCNQYYSGDGFKCTADSDGDTYPNEPLSSFFCPLNKSNSPVYCLKDTCPTVYNIPQSDTSPCEPSGINGSHCTLEVDLTFGFQWGNTQAGTTVTQPCGQYYLGNASRFCNSKGTWSEPDVAGCVGVAFAQAMQQSISLENVSLETVLNIQDTLTVLVEATAPSPNGTSALPMDLQVTANYLQDVVNYYSRALDEGLIDAAVAIVMNTESILDVISNVISTSNLPGAAQLAQVDPQETFAQDILESAEQYGLFLATYLDYVVDIGGTNTMILAADNILMNPSVVDVNEQLEDMVFPPPNTSITNVSGAVISRLEEASINIPSSFLKLRAGEYGVNRVKVSNVIFQNLEMFLSSNIENETLDPIAVILSSQVQQKVGNINGILSNPINLTFSASNQTLNQKFTCVFWDFSLRNGKGGWSTTGVTTTSVTDSGINQTTIQCSSNHLTSFTVLVSVAGANVNTKSLEIVSYIGIGLSLICLLAAIIFFLSFGKVLFTSVHHFVHLNLAIALFLAYLTFAIGIQLAANNKDACHFVAALLHYLFLSVFCWMLCEGVMLYLMLVVVFNELSKNWWFFFLLGWFPPIVFVIIGLASASEQYGVYDQKNNLQFCWLASGGGNFAIWFFVAPMIAIIIVSLSLRTKIQINTVFLTTVLVNLIRRRGNKLKTQDNGGHRKDIIINTIKASVILLPLLGLTWIIGLFVVSQNTLVFAWIFTILNTLQGVFIFFLHVLRHERVWGRFKKKYHLFESTSRSGHNNDTNTYTKVNKAGYNRNRADTSSTSVSQSLHTSSKFGEEKISLDK